MRAAVYARYGPPGVVTIRDLPTPEPGPADILVAVHATTVTTADWRLRAAAFPGALWLPGRLIAGVFGPRKPVLGGEFSGRVVAVGDAVTEFRPGDDVFGFAGTGAHAEFLRMPAAGPVVAKPAGLSHAEAAAIPFGALTALVFFRDFARLVPGERVLVVGAAGGVGVQAVQVARALGATVDGVCGTANLDLVRGLGAERVYDHAREDFRTGGATWDVVFDAVGKTAFRTTRHVLRPGGRHVFLDISLTEMVQALTTALGRGPRVVIGVSGDRKDDLAVIAGLLAEGRLRPVIDSAFSLERIADAHARVDTRHKRGSVVVNVVPG